MNLKQLQEQRGKLRAEAQNLLDKVEGEKRSLSASENESFNKIKDELVKTHEQIAKRSMLADSDSAAAKIRGAQSVEEVENEQQLRSISNDGRIVGPQGFGDIYQQFTNYSGIKSLVTPGSRADYTTDNARPFVVGIMAKGEGEKASDVGSTGTADTANSLTNSTLTFDRYSSKVINVPVDMYANASFNVDEQVSAIAAARVATAFDVAKTSVLTAGAQQHAIADSSAGISPRDIILGRANVKHWNRSNLKLSGSSDTHAELLTELDLESRPTARDWWAIAQGLLDDDKFVINESIPTGSVLLGNFDEGIVVGTLNELQVQRWDSSANVNFEVHAYMGVAVANNDAFVYIS